MFELINSLKDFSKRLNIKIYLVGGFVRDIVLGTLSKDIDIVIERDLSKVLNDISNKYDLYPVKLNNEFNDYKLSINDYNFNFYSLKNSDIYYELKNRDFTINSLALDINDFDSFSKIDNTKIIDPLNGLNDLEKEIIKMNNEDVFEEHPIRMLRAIRLMSQLKFELDNDTYQIIKKKSDLIEKLPGKSIRDELFKILKLEKTYSYFVYMDKLNILEKIFPEIMPMKDVGKCKYHVVDSYTHSIYTLKLAEEIIYADGFFENHLRKEYEKHCSDEIFENRTRIELIKLGAFFHDVGKPSAKWIDETGRTRFKGHEETGAQIIDDIGKRLELSDKERNILYRLVNKHMIPLVLYKSNDLNADNLFKMFEECEDETLDILLIALADIVSTRKLLYPDEEMGKFKVHIEYIANNYITRYKNLKNIDSIIKNEINKDDKLHMLIKKVKKAVFKGEIPNKKEEIIKYIKSSK